MDQEGIMLSLISQRKKNTVWFHLYMKSKKANKWRVNRQSTWKRNQSNDSKDDPNHGNRMEKIQEMFNKALEELKSKQSMMNNTINDIKNSLEGDRKSTRLNSSH